MSDLLNKASLVVIPSGYKEDTVYSVVPSDGSGDLSFTRASNGTRINSAGLVEVCPWNLLQQSETFDNAAWVKQSATVTANSTTAPNGTATADTFNVTATAYSSIYNAGALSLPSGIYTQGIYAKKGTKNYLYILDLTATSAKAWFNLDTGVVGTVASGYTATMESVGNGWYRCSLSQNTSVTPSYFHFGASDSDNSFTPSSSGNIYIWGAQLNIGSTAKPYFPTTDRLNVPRLTYQNGGGGCPSLLLEKQSTNLALYSEDFTNGFWTKDTTTTVTANDGISPDGTQNADRFESPSSIKGIYSYGVSGSETISVYIKAGNSGNVGKSATLFTTLATQDFILTNDWQRISVSGAASSLWALYPSATNSFTNVLIWGAQAEQSSYPTSYIPTTSASATRVADACYKTGISSLIGQTEGTLFVDFDFQYSDSATQVLIKANQTTDANSVGIEVQGTTIKALVNSVGSQIVNISGTISTGRIKAAIAYKTNDFAFYVNGTQVGTDTSGSVAFAGVVDILTIGQFLLLGTSYFPATRPFNESVVFKTRLTNAELASLTTI